ncbi:unnamed protein product, partial [Prorocentrum cordatum]
GAVAVAAVSGFSAALALALAGRGPPRQLGMRTPGVRRADEEGAAGDHAAGCLTAVQGDACYKKVKWAMTDGIHSHPDWYPGLDEHSAFADFQRLLHSNDEVDCQEPCEPAGGESSCAQLGCGTEFDPRRKCQCNADCHSHHSCCSDYKDVCHTDEGHAPGGAHHAHHAPSSTTSSPAKVTTTPYPGGPAPDWCYLGFNGEPSMEYFC